MPFRTSRRRPALAAVLAVLASVLLSTPLALPLSAEARPAAPPPARGSGVTATGPDHAWDPVHKVFRSALPTVRVSQTRNLVDQTIHVTWTDETPSLNDEFKPRPGPSVTYQPGNTYYAVGVFECRGAHPTNFTTQCFLSTAGSTAGNGGLGNAVDTLTYANGSGFADLHVETGVTNSLLDCDATHACSVAVVPVWGGTPPDANTGAPAMCDDHSNDLPNAANGYSPSPPELVNDANIGVQPCSWANRITVPLHFARTPDNCPSASPGFTAIGSPMLERAMSQWQAGWCNQSSPLSLDYNSTASEYQARSSFIGGNGSLTSATNVALTTQPAAGRATRYAYAPLANTDIAVAFLIDNAKTHREITDITLDARLVAKLLTQSYAPLAYACLSGGPVHKQTATCDPAVRGNPQSILKDPEFLKLNPTLHPSDFPYVGNDNFGAFFPTVVAGESDLTYELTRWIASDPRARAFLAGKHDPWGMRVNTYYKGIDYPTSQLAELDPGFVNPQAQSGTGTMQNTWQPVSGLDQVGQLLVGNTSTSLNNTPACSLPPCSLPKLTEQFGARNLFAIMDQGQASAYAFPTARLVNGAGKAVAPNARSVAAGITASARDRNGVTRQPDFASHSASAYPLSVTDYAMVHTCGQSARVARGVSTLLGKVAASQRHGVTPGTLAPGFLSLTRTQLAQLASARRAVGSAACFVAKPHPHPVATGRSHSSPPTTHGDGSRNGVDSTAVDGQNRGDGSNGTGPGPGSDQGSGTAGGTSGPSASPDSAPTSSPDGSPSTSAAPTVEPAAFTNSPDSSGPARFTLPILLILGGALLLLGPLAYALMSGAGIGGLRRGGSRS